jgi:MFS family permease
MGSSLNLSVPAIGEEFMVPASLLGWVVTGYILTVAAFSVPFGRLSDLVGRKKIIVPGLLFYGVTSLLAVYSPTMFYLIVIRGIQGISGAMIFSTNMPFLINAFPPNQRGRVLGFSTAATYAGLSTGPVLGGILNYYLGWRSIFWVVFLLVVSVSIVAIKNLPGGQKGFHREDLKSIDLPGNGLYIFTLIAGIYGFTLLGSQGIALYMVLAGGMTFAAFVWWERKAETPLIKVSLFTQNRGFAFSNLAAMLNYGATFAVGYLMSIYLQLIMGFNSQAAGLVMISQPVISYGRKAIGPILSIQTIFGRNGDLCAGFGILLVHYGNHFLSLDYIGIGRYRNRFRILFFPQYQCGHVLGRGKGSRSGRFCAGHHALHRTQSEYGFGNGSGRDLYGRFTLGKSSAGVIDFYHPSYIFYMHLCMHSGSVHFPSKKKVLTGNVGTFFM